MGDAPERVLGDRRLRHLPRAGRAGDLHRDQGRLAEAERAAAHAASRASRASSAPSSRCAGAMLAPRRRAGRASWRRVHGASSTDADRRPRASCSALALYEAGACRGGRGAVARRARRASPDAAAARVALAEALLSQRRYAEAADEALRGRRRRAACARGRRPLGSLRAAGRRRRDGRRLGARPRAHGRGCRRPSWTCSRPGGRSSPRRGVRPAPLPAAATEPLMTMLEALLRVSDVDAFAHAGRRSSTRSPLPGRERRELPGPALPAPRLPGVRRRRVDRRRPARARRTPTRSPGSAGSRSAGRCPRMRCCSRRRRSASIRATPRRCASSSGSTLDRPGGRGRGPYRRPGPSTARQGLRCGADDGWEHGVPRTGRRDPIQEERQCIWRRRNLPR